MCTFMSREALSIDPVTGAVRCDHGICIKCGLCIKACAHKGIGFIATDGEDRIGVCDLCGGDPKCVKRCFLKAITYEVDDGVCDKDDS